MSERGIEKRSPVVGKLVEGVAIGITVAIILGIYQLSSELVERNRQVRYIREVVTVAREEMWTATDRKVFDVTVLANGLRHTLILEMHATVRRAVATADKLTFEQKNQLQHALWVLDIYLPELAARVGVPKNVVGELFDEFDNMDWLRLPQFTYEDSQ